MAGDHLNAGKAAILDGPLVLAAESAAPVANARDLPANFLPSADLPPSANAK